MIRFKLFFILLIFFPIVIYAQKSTIYNDLSKNEIEWLTNNKNSIKYAPNPFWPPMDYLDEDGNHKGLISDYIELFEEELNIEFQKTKFKTWNDLLVGLKNNETDFVGAIQKTKEREKYLLFSEPYLKSPLVVIIKNNRNFKDKSEINKMKLAIVKGYASIDFIRKKYPKAEIIECEDELAAILKTSLGQADGTVTDLMSASYIVEKYGINNLEWATELNYSWNISFACRKDSPELFSIINKLFKKIDPKDRKEMYEKWINSSTLHKKSYFEKNLNKILIITAIALFCLAITLSFNLILKRRIKKRTDELYEAKVKAEESELLKSAFLANMSHEIRTPMNGIIGFTTLLKEADLTNEEKSLYIDIISKSGERLLNTINDIIDISKIDAQQMHITNEQVNINEVIYDLYNFFKIECDENKVSLKLEIEPNTQDLKILTDRNKFNSILTNLIKNAIKFTEIGEITIGYKINQENYLFFIKDTGIGIPKDRHEAIFNRFIQADIEDKNAFQGSGLGLSIAKAYVEMLEGEIWVESEVNKGSCFYFTIPLNKTIIKNDDASQEKNETETLKSNKKIKILIAEDDIISLTYLSTLLSKLGHEIVHAENGKQAIEICKEQKDIDLILMDIKMPEIDGLEATMEIRKFNKSVYIIAQSAYIFEDDFINSKKVGCNEYLSKPINKNELIKLINNFIESKY
ncbi:response regulator [Flavobacterium sp. N2270]|uniref:response regulator n=1 Tax=Flavobacterium sp. N2270 TaxID=2986831 RepID=UPI002224C71E|nr:transporter substrate-binding domain-containing protein [Flavobacterium sp. N2270]